MPSIMVANPAALAWNTQRRNMFLNPWPVPGQATPAASGEVTLSTAGGRVRATHNVGATAGNDFVVAGLGTLAAGITYGFRLSLTDITGDLDVNAFLNISSPFTNYLTLTKSRAGNVITLTGTYTPSASITGARIIIDFLGAGTGEAYTLAQCICEQGATVAGGYFDGYSYPNDPTLRTVWSGTPYASPSAVQEIAYTTSTYTFPTLILGYETAREGSSLIHEAIDGSIVAVLRPAKPRSGTLRLLYSTEAAAFAALNMHAAGVPFALGNTDRDRANVRASTHMNYVVVPGGVKLARDEVTQRRYIVSVEYQEVSL